MKKENYRIVQVDLDKFVIEVKMYNQWQHEYWDKCGDKVYTTLDEAKIFLDKLFEKDANKFEKKYYNYSDL